MQKERYTALRLGKEPRRRQGPLVGLLIEGSGYRPFLRILNYPGGRGLVQGASRRKPARFNRPEYVPT